MAMFYQFLAIMSTWSVEMWSCGGMSPQNVMILTNLCVNYHYQWSMLCWGGICNLEIQNPRAALAVCGGVWPPLAVTSNADHPQTTWRYLMLLKYEEPQLRSSFNNVWQNYSKLGVSSPKTTCCGWPPLIFPGCAIAAPWSNHGIWTCKPKWEPRWMRFAQLSNRGTRPRQWLSSLSSTVWVQLKNTEQTGRHDGTWGRTEMWTAEKKTKMRQGEAMRQGEEMSEEKWIDY